MSSLFLGLIPVLLSGCGGVPPTLPPEARTKIDRTAIVSAVPQNEVVFQFMQADHVKGHSALNMGSSYVISADTRVFQMSSGIDIYLPGKHKKPAASVVMTSYSTEIGREEGDQALSLWMADHGAAYRRAAQEGI